MSAHRCHREDELLDALARGFVGEDLAAHAGECASCSEIRVVAGALLDERLQAMHEAPVPSAEAMLWRMQMRHRREAQATARRSLLVGQAVTLATAIVLTASFFGADLALELRQVAASIRITPLLLAVATSFLIAPIAGWVAIRQK